MTDLFSHIEARPPAIAAAVQAYAEAGHEERGAVYTRREVVDFILDLNGYTADVDLARRRLLEPSIGEGEFLTAVARRLLASYFDHGGTAAEAARDLAGAVCAVELHADSAAVARRRAVDVLVGEGIAEADATALVDGWVVEDDFLLAALGPGAGGDAAGAPFDHVVGNPPYVRQEAIPEALIAEYRRLYGTIYDRADLYVPFIERGLRLLAPGGRLTYICSDRWVKNKYGGPLRELVADGYRLRHYVDMTDVPAFEGDVIAYPAVFTIERPERPSENGPLRGSGPAREGTRRRNGQGGGGEGAPMEYATLIAERPEIDREGLRSLAAAMTTHPSAYAHGLTGFGSAGDGAPAAPHVGHTGDGDDGRVHPVVGAVSGKEPWLLNRPEELALLRRLERELPTLEEAGLRVGIGVATGADRVFIRPLDELDALGVEDERRLPLALAGNVATAGEGGATTFEWSGKAVLNPFEDDGSLADLDAYPRFAAYVRRHEGALRKRHVAKKSPARWYRTIDRIWPALTERPKLLIPDIKGGAAVAYDAGTAYPHHNLYYVVVDGARRGEEVSEAISTRAWDLRALQAVLRSSVAEFFVASYAVRMRGGFLRFQAQYLRRIRVPAWSDVPRPLRDRLSSAASADREACDAAAFELYGLTDTEGRLVREAIADGGSSGR